MRATAEGKLARAYQGGHPDRAAARLARKLVARHGHLLALLKVSERFERHVAAHTLGGSSPGRVTYWKTVLHLLRRSAPPAMQGERFLRDVDRALASESAPGCAA